MSVGFIMMVHTALDRVAQTARHWATSGCPIVIHCDKAVSQERFNKLREQLADIDRISFAPRFRCEWGTWSIVQATQAAASQLLEKHPEIGHAYLVSGSCLPLRPVDELREYLRARPTTDFIESVTVEDVVWTKGGFDAERFKYRFPFSWKTQRFFFERYVRLQKVLRLSRRLPDGLVPHLGSQWWCLSRATLAAILEDKRRPSFDAFFKRVWIPDESYFQSLARIYGKTIESRSLTLSKFDFQGKPHIFYDDHLQLLRRSDCFVARKIWPHANKLYASFLSNDPAVIKRAEPNPSKIDRLFSKAVDRRTLGRPGLYMQSRFPNENWENGKTAEPYSVFEGFSDLFVNFETWLGKAVGTRVHGHLFAQDRVHFAGGETVFNGGLSDSAELRDYNPTAFLTSLVWNNRKERQCFQFGPGDAQKISWFIATDPQAQVSVISGAWAIRLFQTGIQSNVVRKEAARLQAIEAKHLDVLRSPWAKARVRIWTLADFIASPMENLQDIMDEVSTTSRRRLTEAPRMADLTGFGRFLQMLKNEGMNPYLAGDFPVESDAPTVSADPQKPYLVR